MVFVVANLVESGACLRSKESGPSRSFANPPVASTTDLAESNPTVPSFVVHRTPLTAPVAGSIVISSTRVFLRHVSAPLLAYVSHCFCSASTRVEPAMPDAGLCVRACECPPS